MGGRAVRRLVLVAVSTAAVLAASVQSAGAAQPLLTPQQVAQLVREGTEGPSGLDSIEAVATNYAAALAAMHSGAVPPQTAPLEPVLLVVMRGLFTINVPTPPGDLAPVGVVLTLVLDLRYGGAQTDQSLGPDGPPLAGLGPVEHVALPAGTKRVGDRGVLEVLRPQSRPRLRGEVTVRHGRHVVVSGDYPQWFLAAGTYTVTARQAVARDGPLRRCRPLTVHVRRGAVTTATLRCP